MHTMAMAGDAANTRKAADKTIAFLIGLCGGVAPVGRVARIGVKKAGGFGAAGKSNAARAAPAQFTQLRAQEAAVACTKLWFLLLASSAFFSNTWWSRACPLSWVKGFAPKEVFASAIRSARLM